MHVYPVAHVKGGTISAARPAHRGYQPLSTLYLDVPGKCLCTNQLESHLTARELSPPSAWMGSAVK